MLTSPLTSEAYFRASTSPQMEPAGPFRSFGEQVAAVVKAAAMPDRPPDHRLLQVRAAAIGGSEAVPSDGGFLVQPDFSREIIQRVYLTSQLLKRCFEIPITTGNAIRFPQFDESSRVNGSRLGGVQAFVVPEGASMAALTTKPSFQLTELKAEKILGLMYASSELVNDSGAMAAWIEYALSMECRFLLENLVVNGTGAGQPLGVVNSGACIVVPKQTGQASKSVVSQNVIDMVSRMWAAGRPNAIWLYNQNILSQLAQLSVVVGVAGSQSNLWQFCFDASGIDHLAGIPAFPSEYCQSAGAVGDLILADFSRYALAVREQGRMDVSIHLRFDHDEQAFRFTIRANGTPLDSRPILPPNGTDTTSPFVALAAR